MIGSGALFRGTVGLTALCAALAACHPGEDPATPPALNLLDRRPHVVAESRFLTFGAGDRRHLVRGWHGDEWNAGLRRHFVWAHGRRATVDLRILQVLDQQVLVELSPVALERPARIDVSLNGKRVTTIEPAPGFREYRFLLPASLLRRGRNRLAFDHAVVGPPPRRLAASYSWILLGPECLRLRPKGTPPDPPGVEETADGLDVRGPAELSWKTDLPGDPRLRVRAEVGEDPVRLVVDARDPEGWHRVGEARLAPAWIGHGVTRHASFDLAPWSERPVRLRIGVLPEPCHSPFAEARLVEVAIDGTRADGRNIDKSPDLSR